MRGDYDKGGESIAADMYWAGAYDDGLMASGLPFVSTHPPRLTTARGIPRTREGYEHCAFLLFMGWTEDCEEIQVSPDGATWVLVLRDGRAIKRTRVQGVHALERARRLNEECARGDDVALDYRRLIETWEFPVIPSAQEARMELTKQIQDDPDPIARKRKWGDALRNVIPKLETFAVIRKGEAADFDYVRGAGRDQRVRPTGDRDSNPHERRIFEGCDKPKVKYQGVKYQGVKDTLDRIAYQFDGNPFGDDLDTVVAALDVWPDPDPDMRDRLATKIETVAYDIGVSEDMCRWGPTLDQLQEAAQQLRFSDPTEQESRAGS